MRTLAAISLVLLATASAGAGTVPLEPYSGSAFSVGMPRGWKVTADDTRGIIVAQEDPSRKDAAAVLLVTSTSTAQSADALIDAVAGQFASGLQVARREAIPGGGNLLVADGRVGDVVARLGVIAVVHDSGSVVCLVAARPSQFGELGGIDLVVAVLSSLQANAPPPSAAPAAQPAPDDNPSVIPPPARPLRVADLVGEWKKGDSNAITTYVNATTGAYAGFNAIITRDHWVIAPNGRLQGEFQGVHAGNGGPYAVNSKYGATVSVSADGVVLAVKKDADANATKYIVRGWAERPNGTVLVLNGPFYSDLPQDCLDPKRCINLNNTWVRPRTPPK